MMQKLSLSDSRSMKNTFIQSSFFLCEDEALNELILITGYIVTFKQEGGQ